MTAVQLDLALGLEAFYRQVELAEQLLLGVKGEAAKGASLKLFLDTSSLKSELAAARNLLSNGNTTIKVGTDFYKTGSQYAISATKLKNQIIDPIQQKVADDRKYKIKIGTELAFDQSSLQQIDQIVAKAKASLKAVERSTAATRSQLTQLTQTSGQGGLDAAALRKLQSAAGQVGIKTTSTGATELRKELRDAFTKAGDEAINGLAKGLVSKSSTVIDASTQTGKDLIKALKKTLGIASPSKETRKLGQASADGFGQGFVGGMVAWERQMAQSIRQAIGNAFQQGLSRDAAARGALVDMGRDAGAVLSQSLAKSLKQGLASSVAPALKGALLGGAGGAATGGVVGGLAAAGSAIQRAASPAMLEFGYGSVPQKLGMLGHGAASLASGGASDAFNALLQQSVDAVVQAAMSSGSQGALLGAAGVAGVAGIAGLAKGAGGSLVSQAVESIKNRILGTAVQEAQAQAQLPGSTAGAVSAPVENASGVMGGLQTAVSTVARGLLDFAKELTPGKLQQRIIDIAWNIDQAAEQFGVLKKDTQVLAGKVRNTWSAFSNNTPSQLLPPQPVAGTGLVRQQNMQLGGVVGRTAFDFRGPAYGSEGNRIGPADIGEGRGYIEQTRNTLQAIAGRPGEWKVVEEANGVWQRIKSDSELAQERLALIAKNLTKKGNEAYRTWTDREGVGTFNPFDQAFYRPTRPPQAPPRLGISNLSPTESRDPGPNTPSNNAKSNNAKGYSRLTNEITLKLVSTYVEALRNAIPQVEAASRKLAAAPTQAAQKAVAANDSGLPKNAVKNITSKTSSSRIDIAASSLLGYAIDPSAIDEQGKMLQKARDIVRKKGAYPLIENIPGVDYNEFANDASMGRSTETTRMVKKAFLDFYGINDKGVPTTASSAVASAEAAAGSANTGEQEARQLAQAVAELVNGLASITDFVKSSSDQARRVSGIAAQSNTGTQSRSQTTAQGSLPVDSNFIRTGLNSFGSDGRGGGGGGNRFGTPNPGGALAMRNVPVEVFTSFKDAERLLNLVEQRLAAVGRAFDTLKVKSQVQVDQEIRKLAVSLRAVELAFQKGEISATDLQAATYGAARAMADLNAKGAQVQNVAQAFNNLGSMSSAERQAIERQRNMDVDYVQSVYGQNSLEGRRAGNARDVQQLQYANDLVRGAQGASGFGGFRGREIGNDTLNKALQATNLKEYINQFDELSANMLSTERNAKTYQRVQAALTEEFGNAERALRVLNGQAKAGETATHLARNAWGTILDDFQNLVPQLLVFAVAYNLILQRVLTTPGAVIQAAAAFDRLETSISAYLSATRGIGDASGTIQELQQVALDLGIGFEKAASSYLRFAAATQGTPLEGQEVEITRTLATAGRNQGLGGEQIDRASVALTQILSKGRVQSEELRGQLAEQLPGALQVAARAFGVTTKELYRMVEAGQIAGDEFVGRFMRQLRAEGASTNQLAGSFSNVSEQLGSSIQTLAATAGQPMLAPLTVGLQAVNAVIQALIPVAPVVTGLFVALGAQALRSALGVKSLSAELVGVVRNLFVAESSAKGFHAGLANLIGVARIASTVLATVGKATLIGLAFETVAGTIRYIKGEIGALGDELKKVNKIAEGGQGQGLNGLQKLLGNYNIAQDISDTTTFFDARKIGRSTDQLTGKIVGNQKKIAASVREVNRIDRQLYEERIRRDQAEANKDDQGVARSLQKIKELERKRGEVKFEVSAEDAQIQIGAMKAAEQAMQKLIDRQKSLGNSSAVEDQNLKLLRKTREEFEKTAKAAGLLDQKLLKIQSLGALQSRLKANQEILPTLDVNSDSFRAQQVLVAGLQQAVTDQQLLPQERALKTQETVLRRMSTELKVQENIQRIKLGLFENERKALEAVVSLERTRGQLREAVAQRRVDVAGALNAPEEQLAAEVQLRRVREGNQAKELQMQGRLLGKDRERVGIETSLQKEQIKLQTQQLAIDKQMLAIERLKMEAAAKQSGISADLRRSYYLQLGQIDKTIAATNTLIGQEGSLLRSVEQKGAAELSVLGIKQQELDVQLQILGTSSLTAQQVEQIKAAQQDIANNEAEALSRLQAANKALEAQQQTVEGQLDAVRATVEAQRERARLAEETAAAEMGLLDRMLELQQGRNDGGFFERMAKASLLGASGEQEAYAIAERRMQLQREIQEQQQRQKRLDLALKKQELEAEKALNALKLQGLKIANEEAKVSLRAKLEKSRLTLEQLGGKGTEFYKQVTDAQVALGGYNPAAKGNSVNNQVSDTLRESQSVFGRDRAIADLERSQNQIYGERSAALDNLVNNEERLLGIQQQLFDLDAAQWFGQFLDKSTQLGRTLGVVTTGLSEFRSTVSQAFSDAITNGANASEAIADAGQALAGKFATGLLDELVLKPLEANLFKGLSQVFGFEKPQSEQQATAANTAQTKQAVNEVNASVELLQGVIREGDAAVVAAINGIAKPTTATPVYRAPENAGMTSAVPAAAGGSSGGKRAFFGATGNVNNGDPSWVHAHLQSVVGSASQTVEDGLRLVRELMAKGVPVEVGSGVTKALNAAMGDDQIRGALRRAISQHTHSGGGTALDVWVPKGTEVPVPLTDIRNTPGAAEGINGLLPGGKTFAGHLDPKSVGAGSFSGSAATATKVPSAPLAPATMSALPMALQFDSVMDTRSGKPIPVTVVPHGGSGPATLEQAGALTNSTLPALSAATSENLGQLSNDASELSSSLSGLSGLSQEAMASFASMDASFWAAAGGMNEVAGAASKAPTMFSQLSTAIGAATQALAGIGMISGGVGMMQEGGTYETLMGLAGIFGGIASITGSMSSLGGMFGGGGGGGGGGGSKASWGSSFNTSLTQTQGMNPLPTSFNPPGRAVGGSVVARKPYKVQETGFELFVPQGNGTVLSNSRSRALLQARSAIANSTPDTADASDHFAASRDALNYSSGLTKERNTERALTTSLDTSAKPLDIRYQSEVINQTEYVSVDQFQRGMTEAAERGRGLTLSALKNSVRARRQVGF